MSDYSVPLTLADSSSLNLRSVQREARPKGRPVCCVEGKSEVKTFIRMLKDESGASAAEYALILAIVGAGIAAAAIILGHAITGAMTSAATCITTSTTC